VLEFTIFYFSRNKIYLMSVTMKFVLKTIPNCFIIAIKFFITDEL